jgi:hypothetical protein
VRDPSDDPRLDLGRDVVTTSEDVRMLRDLRAQCPSWLELSADEFDACCPTAPSIAGRPPHPTVGRFVLE